MLGAFPCALLVQIEGRPTAQQPYARWLNNRLYRFPTGFFVMAFSPRVKVKYREPSGSVLRASIFRADFDEGRWVGCPCAVKIAPTGQVKPL
jgi:hypothetical protein